MAELGTKFECFSCGAKFYDLGKPDPLCPKCGANQKDARKHDAASEQAAKRRRKDEIVRANVDEEELLPAAGDVDLSDEELVTPEAGDDDHEDAADEEDLDDEE